MDYLCTTIGCSPDDVDLDASFNDLGVGSRDSVVLSGELSELVGRPVSPVEFWAAPDDQRAGGIPDRFRAGIGSGCHDGSRPIDGRTDSRHRSGLPVSRGHQWTRIVVAVPVRGQIRCRGGPARSVVAVR